MGRDDHFFTPSSFSAAIFSEGICSGICAGTDSMVLFSRYQIILLRMIYDDTHPLEEGAEGAAVMAL
jgi:hypothetical protein